ncbi:MAG: hypothetical protein WKG07_02545 [Hymenobacter sp.]
MKLPLLLLPLCLSCACSSAADNVGSADQPQETTQTHPGKKGKKGHKKHNKEAEDLPSGLRRVGRLSDGIRESSGLCAAPEAGTYLTFGDDGNLPTVWRVDATGQQVGEFTPGAPNRDWESLSRDPSGNYYLGDCGNNNSDRQRPGHSALPARTTPPRSAKSTSTTPTKPSFRPTKRTATSTAKPASGTPGRCIYLPKTGASPTPARFTPCPTSPVTTRPSS